MVTSEREARVAAPPREAAGLRHAVHLTGVSEVLGAAPARSAPTAALVRLDRERAAGPGAPPLEEDCARALVAEFATP